MQLANILTKQVFHSLVSKLSIIDMLEPTWVRVWEVNLQILFSYRIYILDSRLIDWLYLNRFLVYLFFVILLYKFSAWFLIVT